MCYCEVLWKKGYRYIIPRKINKINHNFWSWYTVCPAGLKYNIRCGKHLPPMVCEWTWSNPAYDRVWEGLWSVPKNWDFVFFQRARNQREWCPCSTCNRLRWSDRFSSHTPCTCSVPAFSSRCRLYAPGCLRWCAAAAVRQINRENYMIVVYILFPEARWQEFPWGMACYREYPLKWTTR